MNRKPLLTIVLAVLTTVSAVITSCTSIDDDPVVRATDTDSEEEDYWRAYTHLGLWSQFIHL